MSFFECEKSLVLSALALNATSIDRVAAEACVGRSARLRLIAVETEAAPHPLRCADRRCGVARVVER